MVIASSTLALRITIFPWLLLQLHKLKKIEQLFPKCKIFKSLSSLAHAFLSPCIPFLSQLTNVDESKFGSFLQIGDDGLLHFRHADMPRFLVPRVWRKLRSCWRCLRIIYRFSHLLSFSEESGGLVGTEGSGGACWVCLPCAILQIHSLALLWLGFECGFSEMYTSKSWCTWILDVKKCLV